MAMATFHYGSSAKYRCRHEGCEMSDSSHGVVEKHERKFEAHRAHVDECLRRGGGCVRCRDLARRQTNFAVDMYARYLHLGLNNPYAYLEFMPKGTLPETHAPGRAIGPVEAPGTLGAPRGAVAVDVRVPLDDGGAPDADNGAPPPPPRDAAVLPQGVGSLSLFAPSNRKRPHEDDEAADQDSPNPPAKKISTRMSLRLQQNIARILEDAECEANQSSFEPLLNAAWTLFLTAGQDEAPSAVYTAVARAFAAGLRKLGTSIDVVKLVLKMWYSLAAFHFTYEDISVNRDLLFALCAASVPPETQRQHAVRLLVELVRGAILTTDAAEFQMRASNVLVAYVERILSAPGTSVKFAEQMPAADCFGNGPYSISPHLQYRLLVVILRTKGTANMLPTVLQVLEKTQNRDMGFGTPAQNAAHLRDLTQAVLSRVEPGSLPVVCKILSAIVGKQAETSFHRAHDTAPAARQPYSKEQLRATADDEPAHAGASAAANVVLVEAPASTCMSIVVYRAPPVQENTGMALRLQENIMRILEDAGKEPDPRNFELLTSVVKSLFAAAGDKNGPALLYATVATAFTTGLSRFASVSTVVDAIIKTWGALPMFWRSPHDKRTLRELLLALCNASAPGAAMREPAFAVASKLMRTDVTSNNSHVSNTFVNYFRRLLDCHTCLELAMTLLQYPSFGVGGTALPPSLQYRLLAVVLAVPGVTCALLGKVLDIIDQLKQSPTALSAPEEHIKYMYVLYQPASELMNHGTPEIVPFAARIGAKMLAALAASSAAAAQAVVPVPMEIAGASRCDVEVEVEVKGEEEVSAMEWKWGPERESAMDARV